MLQLAGGIMPAQWIADPAGAPGPAYTAVQLAAVVGYWLAVGRPFSLADLCRVGRCDCATGWQVLRQVGQFVPMRQDCYRRWVRETDTSYG
jgi:hypothetical protein